MAQQAHDIRVDMLSDSANLSKIRFEEKERNRLDEEHNSLEKMLNDLLSNKTKASLKTRYNKSQNYLSIILVID